MNLKGIAYYTGRVILVGLLVACVSTGKTSRTNLAFLYNPEVQFASLESAVFHSNDTTSELFVKVSYNDLVYMKDPFSGIYACSYRLTWKMWNSYESAEVLASHSELAGDSINYGKNAWNVHSFRLPARYPGNYVVELEIFDLNRNAASKQYLDVRKTVMNGRQNFLVFNQDEMLIFRNYLHPGNKFKIVTDDPSIPALTVSCYFRDFPLARPPFTSDREPVFDYEPDSLFTVDILTGQTEWIELHRLGFYHFRKDISQKEGMTMFIFDEGFPEIYTAGQLRDPLRYITTGREYDTLQASDQPKAAVDNFWLRIAGNEERAKSLIQKYYRNVEESNLYFTSYLEGWKTDRGLVYTVLGKPNIVYRSDGAEEWIYGEPENRNSLWFTFVKVKNPFTNNDYMLLRSPTFKDPWNITVQSWRR